MLLMAPALAAADGVGPPLGAAAAPAEGATRAVDPCLGEAGDDPAAIDRMRVGVFRGVCTASRWFDGLFGGAREFSESYGQAYGRAGAGLVWDERDKLPLDVSLRAHLPLPILGERFDAVAGREPADRYLNDDLDDVDFLPGSFSDEGLDSTWYAGINYGQFIGRNARTDLSAGLQFATPLNPYLKYRYRYYAYPLRRVRVGLRSTAFWENADGAGVTQAVDADWSLRDDLLLRWANSATFAEATAGVRWKSRVALFRQLSDASALRLEASVRGETDGLQPDLRGFGLTYRHSVWREWFFIEAGVGMFWAESLRPERRCDACLRLGLSFDLLFGERYDTGFGTGPGAADDKAGQ